MGETVKVAVFVVLLAVMAVGVTLELRASDDAVSCKTAVFYLSVLFLAFVFSFGMSGPFVLLSDFVPGFDAVRALIRWHALAMLALAVFAAVGFHHVSRRFHSRFSPGSVAAVLMVLMAIEYACMPLAVTKVPVLEEIPAVYHWIAHNLDTQEPVVELPLTRLDQSVGRIEIKRVYFSSYHFRPIVNGYSGYTPPLYRELQRRWQTLTLESNLDDLRQLGVRYVILHRVALRRRRLRPLLEKPILGRDLRLVQRARRRLCPGALVAAT